VYRGALIIGGVDKPEMNRCSPGDQLDRKQEAAVDLRAVQPSASISSGLYVVHT
jgi:hypothetical protein